MNLLLVEVVVVVCHKKFLKTTSLFKISLILKKNFYKSDKIRLIFS